MKSIAAMRKAVLAAVSGATATALAAVTFVECPKCDKRIRISDDGREAFVNMSRIDAAQRGAMAARAERLLERARPVVPADPSTPLMGWSSWNTFALDISEDIIVGVARTMATNGLKAAGYVYVNIDDGFFDGHGEDGRLRFHPQRFPNGMKGTVDGIHALGMKAGTYSDAGADTCGSMGGDKSGVGAGLYGHDASDCALHFKELGFDFFKVDFCGGRKLKLEEKTRYAEIAEAIKATGRKDVRLNICRWAFPGTWAADVAGSWRTTRDIRASWKSIRNIIAENLYLSAFARSGHFNDLDMLEVGQVKGFMKSAFGKSGDTGITPDEEITHFGMWCMLSSPLVLGNDVRIIPPATLRLVTNPYLIRMNQDPLGLQAYVAARDGDAYVLVKDAETRFGPSRYVALYNAGDGEHTFTVSARALDLGGKIAAFDLVERADMGEFEGEVCVKVRPHASKFYLFDAERRLDRIMYEAEAAYLTDYSEIDDSSYGSTNSCRVQGRAYHAPVAHASGGMVVVNLGGRETNDIVWKDVHVSEPGPRRLVFRGSSPERRKFFVQVDGGVKRELDFPATGEWSKEVSLPVNLARGVHTVRLSNASAPMPDIDFMRIGDPMVEDVPGFISPHRADWDLLIKPEWAADLHLFTSTADATLQPVYIRGPKSPQRPVPLVIGLHSWGASGRWADPARQISELAAARGWAFAYPHFRGPNRNPMACGSEEAVQDIFDTVALARKLYPIDPDRIYITGGSGGGHMAMLMAGRAPRLFAAVAEFCGIYDLVRQRKEMLDLSPRNPYARDIESACGGLPDTRTAEYARRSPLGWLDRARDAGTPVYLCAGIHDGHRSGVAPGHSLRGFNALADVKDRLDEDFIGYVWKEEKIPAGREFTGDDPFYAGQKVLFRATSAAARLTIFEGGHGCNYPAAFDFFDRQRRGRPVDWTVGSPDQSPGAAAVIPN